MTELRRTPPRLLIVLAFLSVYFCWSATYTAMRVGVALLPATVLAGVRMLMRRGYHAGVLRVARTADFL